MHSSLRLIAAWVLVMGSAAGALKALDLVPTLVSGIPRRARVYSSMEEAEAAVGARVWLPSYYPDDLRWPPSRVEASPAAPVSVVVRIAGRDDASERLVVAQSIGQVVAVPTDLLAAGVAMETTGIAVGARPAHLIRVLVGSREVHDLWWDQGGRRVTLRYAGPVDRLLLIAGSLERRARELGAR